jgi:pSer/pThr/pTyr-binding forkhead associated (FHA) protein
MLRLAPAGAVAVQPAQGRVAASTTTRARATRAAVDALQPLQSPSFTLEVVEGPGRGSTGVGGRHVEIGRDVEHFRITDELSSRRHAVMHINGSEATLEDLGSVNGTYVNGDRLNSPTSVSAGDSILIGRTVLVLRHLEAGDR